jgi:hypothetical protein
VNIGDVIYDPDFQFPDGGHADKLFILMSNPAENYVFVILTTSRSDRRKTDQGCQPSKKEFFIRAGREFVKDTWLLLWREPVFLPTLKLKSRLADGICTVKTTLSQQRVNEVRNCLARHCSDSFTREHCALIGIDYRG